MGHCIASSVHAHCVTVAEEISASVWTWVHIGVWPCVHLELYTLLLHMTSVKVLSHSLCTLMNIMTPHLHRFYFIETNPFCMLKVCRHWWRSLSFIKEETVKIPAGPHGWIRTYWANSEWKKSSFQEVETRAGSISIYKHIYYIIMYNTSILPLMTVKWINNWLWSNSSESFILSHRGWLSKRE